MMDNLVEAARLSRPDAVLLDFNGIITETTNRSDRLLGIADRVHDLLVACGVVCLTTEQIHEDLDSAQQMHRAWRRGTTRRQAPRTIGHREFWAEFVAADWPKPARDTVVANAPELTRVLHTYGKTKRIRSGIPEFLRMCRSLGIPCGIVSNTFMGELNREIAHGLGVAEFFAVQVYADEVGMTKPNPRMIWLATDALAVDPSRCWFVGDQVNRDVLGCRRAGIGTAILMRSATNRPDAIGARAQPDAIIADPHRLIELLDESTTSKNGE